MLHNKRKLKTRRKNPVVPVRHKNSIAILVGNAVTTSAELPTNMTQGVFYSEGILGIGPSGNVSERDTKAL